MIKEIRQYFIDAIKSIDNDFKEHKDGFNFENIPSSKLDKGFFIQIGNMSSTRADKISDDNLTVTVKLFFKGYNDPQSAIDSGYDKAIQVRLKAGGFENIGNDAAVCDVTPTSITPEPLDTNDNVVIINIEFNVRLFINLS
jgi:hypothetical protein